MAIFYKDLSRLIHLDKNISKLTTPELILMTKDFNVIGKIGEYTNWNASILGNSIDEFSCDIAKYVDGKKNQLWDKITDLKVIEILQYGRFEISVTYTDNTKTVKSIQGYSLECELGQLYLNDFHVNDDDATTMKLTEYNKDDFDSNGNFIPTTFYNPDDQKHSLLHRVLADKAPHWSIGYVTPYISLDDDYTIESSKTFQRMFTVDSTSIYDFLTQDLAQEANVVFLFDTIHRIINCYSLSDGLDENGNIKHISIGEDTNVYVSKNNLAQEISLQSNKDEIKNCFRVQGGDDTINAYVRALNISGSNYIFKFDAFQQEDMPKELIDRLKEYQEDVESKKPKYQQILNNLFKAYDRLSELKSSMMPGNADESVDKWISATSKEMYSYIKNQLIDNKIAVSDLKLMTNNTYVAINNNIEAMAQVYGDSRFEIKLLKEKCNYDSATTTWTGNFTVTKVDDNSDYYPKTQEQKDSTFSVLVCDDNTLENSFIKQKILIKLNQDGVLDIDEDIYKILAENEEFTDEKKQKIYDYFNQYSLNRLSSYKSGYDACLSILQEANVVSTDTQKNPLYERYRIIYGIVCDIYDIRSEEVDNQNKLISDIKSQQSEMQTGLDLKSYLGVDLYNVMCIYRREDTYENSNYVSDNLTDSEALKKAQELLDVATKELNKACVVQRTISTTLNNIFALPEFESLWDSFQLYNYIRIRTDDELLKLRIIGFEINGDSYSDITVTFADKIDSIDGKTNDTKSILDQAQSMTSSYDATVLQAKQGQKANNKFTDIYNNGLSAANAMIKNDNSETFTITSAGAIAKRMDDVGFYGDKQLRITGNLIAMTKDNWQTVSMALGETEFANPYTGETSSSYGVIAENIVGKMILTKNLYVASEDGNLTIDGHGITLSSKQAIKWDTTNSDYVLVETNYKQYCLIEVGLEPDSNTSWLDALPVWIENKEIWSRNVYKHADDTLTYSNPILENGLTKTYTNFTDFQNKVKNNLYDGTEITQDSIITPKIGGGYAYFTNGNYSVEIDPNNNAGNNTLKGYLFCIRKGKDPIMGVDTKGNGVFNGNGVFKGRGEFSSGSFKGNIDATQLKLYKNNTFYGQFDFGHHTYNNSEYYGLGIISANEEQPIDGDINHRRISFGIGTELGTELCENIYFDLRSDKSGWDSKHIFDNKCEFYDNPSVKNGCYLKFFPDDGTKNNWTQLSYNTMNGTGEELIYTPNSLYVQQNLYANNGFKVQLQTSSDIRLKKEIQSLNDVKDLYLGFKPKQYKFKTNTLGDDEQIRYGLIANEVKSNLDRCGYNSSDYQIVETYQTNGFSGQQAYIRDGVGLRINYENLHALHIAFGQQIYKELTDKIDALQKELQELKEKI